MYIFPGKSLLWLNLFLVFVAVVSQCPNRCSLKGLCTTYSTCECFEGYGGNDCSRRLCPKGPALVDVPQDTDKAHALAECSNNGECNYQTGDCECFPGFTGHNCARLKCFNDCNGHGRCMSLRQAAAEYDGYQLTHRTVYERWDADVIHGCICDYGYSGADCSQRSCEYGIDPRLSDAARERITLVCRCSSGGCSGKFKLQFFGSVLNKWLYPSSTVEDVLKLLQTAPGIISDTTGLNLEVITANRSTASTICVKNQAVSTEISFRRNAGDLPAVSFYANLVDHGELFFETKQTLMCDCLHRQCNGTFRLAFDEEMTPAINSFTNGSNILHALHNMETLRTSGYTVTAGTEYTDGPLCADYQAQNFTIVFRGAAGNAPRLSLWSSVTYGQTITYFSTNETFAPLRLVTDDGRQDHVKLCNGIGNCNFNTGECLCPAGWKFDANIGPCGKPSMLTSDWGGVGRCPGTIAAVQMGVEGPNKRNYDAMQNYATRVILSIDPIPLNGSQPADAYTPEPYSSIRMYSWKLNTLNGPAIDTSTETLVTYLTSDTSAGPLVVDHGKEQVIFVDTNPAYPFIGKASLLPSGQNNYTRWYTYDDSATASPYKAIASLAFDARAWRRILYWSTPAGLHTDDGEIYFARIDEVNPTVYTLSTIIGATSNTFSPLALSIDYENDRLYWTDRADIAPSGDRHGVLRSCSLSPIGADCWEDHVIAEVEGVALSLNFTDMVIDFSNNHTLYLVDNAKDSVRVVAIGLALPTRYNNKTQEEDADVFHLNRFYHSPRMIFNASVFPMTDVPQMVLDSRNDMMLLVDIGYERVTYSLTVPNPENTFPRGVAYSGRDKFNHKTQKAVGITLDFGFGPVRRDDIADCYGRGICTGVEGAFTCECSHGYFGDCQAAKCPMGKAWFHEPHVHNVAHDVDMECSNAGLCNRFSGECECFEGFEGHACQRRSCLGSSLADDPLGVGTACFNRGRCLSMRELGLHHRAGDLEKAPVVYGSQAGNADTWDADRIQGCKADEYGYFEGLFNVSTPRDVDIWFFDCPMGFNTRLLGAPYVNSSALNATQMHVLETQQIVCRGGKGYFRVSFRGRTSSRMHANMTEDQVKAALQSIPGLGAVSVSMSDSQLCPFHRQIGYTTVTFLSQVGPVAMLKIDENYLQGRRVLLEVVRLQASEPGEVYECSGHGNCNFQTGKCRCYPGYAASDGRGNPGNREDCGFNIVV